MFFQKIRWLILAVIAFASGVIITVQWIGTDYGMNFYDAIKRPEVVEKIKEVETFKVITISDDLKIQAINQEYRDALLKISAMGYNSSNGSSVCKEMKRYAVDALSIPEEMYKNE